MAITQLDTASWPEKLPVADGKIGHNRPPVAIEAKAAFDERIDAHDGLRKKIADLIGASDRAVCTSAETNGKCGQTVVQIRAAMKRVADAHVDAKASYLEGGRVVDAAKNDLHEQLAAAKVKIEYKQTVFLRAQEKTDAERRAKIEAENRRVYEENERIRREHEAAMRKANAEADQIARDAAAKGEPAPEVDLPPPPPEPVYVAPLIPVQIDRGITRGPEGAAVSAKKVTKAEIIDYAAAFSMLQKDQKVREAMDAAASRFARAGVPEIPGVRIWQDVGVSNR